MKKQMQMDMLSGALLPKILLFSLPLAATGVLQLLFNAADIIVVGKFAGSSALAAVGSTASLINLLVGAFMGISVGVNILVARYLGCRNQEAVERAVHTAYALSGLMSVFVTLLGLVASRPMLQWMDTPPEILDQAALYLRIYFLGIPASLMYNFGAAILRAIGDTRRPMWYLVISGVINVILNLVLVILFHLDVAGVAIATIVSQYVSLALVTRCLIRTEGPCKLTLRHIRMDWNQALQMIQIGLPVGLQSVIFSLSNVLIQSTVNAFGESAIAGKSAATSVAGFTYTAMNAVSHGAITFTSQNLGAGKLHRVNRIFGACLLTVTVIGGPLCILLYVFGPQVLSVYVNRQDPNYDAVILEGMKYLLWLNLPYLLCGYMETACGMVRGLGQTWLPMIISAVGACALRLIWLWTVFPLEPTLDCLYFSYPVSWIITTAAHMLCYVLTLKSLKKRRAAALPAAL